MSVSFYFIIGCVTFLRILMPVCWLVCQLVGLLVCHNFLTGLQVTHNIFLSDRQLVHSITNLVYIYDAGVKCGHGLLPSLQQLGRYVHTIEYLLHVALQKQVTFLSLKFVPSTNFTQNYALQISFIYTLFVRDKIKLKAVFRIWIRIIWPDPFQTIQFRIRVAPKTYQNHEKKCPLKYYLHEERKILGV